MSKLKTYTVTKHALARLLSYYQRIGKAYVCRRCREQFKAGDKVTVTGVGTGTRSKHYHMACYDSMLV